jgi:hypothetical protein
MGVERSTLLLVFFYYFAYFIGLVITLFEIKVYYCRYKFAVSKIIPLRIEKISLFYFVKLTPQQRFNGNASVILDVRCLGLVIMYGNSPRKLFTRIITNDEVKMNEFFPVSLSIS